MKLAFYKGKKGRFSRLIGWWKNAEYTHVECLIHGMSYTSSELDGGVVKRQMEFKKKNWTVIDVPWQINEEQVTGFFESQMGKNYDWMGIVKSQILGANRHNKNRWFCSEICAKAIGLTEPHRYDPQGLYNIIMDFKNLNKLWK